LSLHGITDAAVAPVWSDISCMPRSASDLWTGKPGDFYYIYQAAEISVGLQSRLNWHRDVVTDSCPVVIAKLAAREIAALQESGNIFNPPPPNPWENGGFTCLKITCRLLGLSCSFSRGYLAFNRFQQKVS